MREKMRETAVYSLSFALTAAVIGNAVHQKKQFYPAVVYLTKSSPSMAILACQSLVFVVLLGKLTRKVFFGQLRAAEIDHLIDRAWYTVTETCLAFTVFREEFSPIFVAMFTMLLFFKCFHWLLEDRVDYMERSPMLGVVFHARVHGLAFALTMIDIFSIKYAVTNTLEKGASSHMVFGFEYMVLIVIMFTVMVKYVLHTIDSYSENPWENKAVYILYLDLVANALKCVLYLAFVTMMTKVHTFPLFAIRPLYMSMRNLKRTLIDVVNSRRAIRNLNESYQAPTAEELRDGDVCIICREGMTPEACKKLPCSHIFHSTCLRNWFQRQQTCPTCRMEILRPTAANPVPGAAPANPNGGQPGVPPPNQPIAQPWQHFQRNMFMPNNVNVLRMPPANPVQGPAQPANANAPSAPLPANQQPVSLPTAPYPTQPGAGAAGALIPTPQMPEAIPGHTNLPPFMVPLPPPAMPQPDLQGLTDEQLGQLEGYERTAVLARVQWLRDIQTLLDAAMLQMNVYTTVMGSMQLSTPLPHASAPAPPVQHYAPEAPEASGYTPNSEQKIRISPPAYTMKCEASQPTLISPQAHGGARPKTSQSALSPESKVLSEDPPPVLPQTPDTSNISTEEEVRQRRLARFLNVSPSEERPVESKQQYDDQVD